MGFKALQLAPGACKPGVNGFNLHQAVSTRVSAHFNLHQPLSTRVLNLHGPTEAAEVRAAVGEPGAAPRYAACELDERPQVAFTGIT
jgi:hypothetical protein